MTSSGVGGIYLPRWLFFVGLLVSIGLLYLPPLPDILGPQLDLARYEQIVGLLPHQRPPDWPYRSLDTNRRLVIANTSSGAVNMYLEHAPLPGVNSTHMDWWFHSHHDPNAGILHPQTGELTTAYLLWHPRDHISSCYQPGSDRKQIHIIEILLSAEGFTTSLRPPEVDAFSYELDPERKSGILVSSIARIAQLDEQALQLEFAIPPVTAPFAIMRHAWEDSPEGVLIKTNFTLGTNAEAAWLQTILRVTNSLLLRASMPNVESWLQLQAKHCVEEFGNLPFFLPSFFEGLLQPPDNASGHFDRDTFVCPPNELEHAFTSLLRYTKKLLGFS